MQKEIATIKGIQQTVLDQLQSSNEWRASRPDVFDGPEKSTKYGYAIGDILTLREIQRRSYYPKNIPCDAPNERFFKNGPYVYLEPGQPAVIGAIGGPYDFCLDFVVDGEQFRCSARHTWIKRYRGEVH
jgi:hypothetical protein